MNELTLIGIRLKQYGGGDDGGGSSGNPHVQYL